ncbi:MAG: hypothetical protein F6K14_14005 [Symploca sp. SIO2C1]|nr:hypothetical protein [Symploca sp. SIO2C1]
MTDTVNKQVTDAVTQTGVNVVGGAPSQSMSMVYQSMAHSISLLMQNSVSNQGGMQQINAAIVASACKQILTASTPEANPPVSLPTTSTNSQNNGGNGNGGNGNGGNGNGGNGGNGNGSEHGQLPTTAGNKDEDHDQDLQKQLRRISLQIESALRLTAQAASEAGEHDANTASTGESTLESSDYSQPQVQKKLRELFSLSRTTAKSAKIASDATARAYALANKAEEAVNASDLDTTKHYAEQVEEQAKVAQEAAAQAKTAAERAETIDSDLNDSVPEHNKPSKS